MPNTPFLLPPLYSRTSTGALQIWRVYVKDNMFWTESGQITGKTTISKPTICKGKNIGRANETTGEEQARLEAQSKWDKKAKTGYFENVKDVDNFYFVEPMLATPLRAVKKGIQLPCLVQTKLNGGRVVITRHGAFTRKGERYEVLPHILKALEPFFEKWPNAVLDGEGYNAALRQQLNEIMRILRKNTHVTVEILEKSKRLIRLALYDGYGFYGMDESVPYANRKHYLDELAKSLPDALEVVEDHVCNTEAEVWAIYEDLIADKHEGAIVRYADNTYEHKRSKDIIKLKPTDDAEFIILKLHEGKGNWSGACKRIDFQLKKPVMVDGVLTHEFGGTFKGTQEQATWAWNNPSKLVGKLVTVQYNGFTGYGIPNYAQFDFNNAMNDKAIASGQVFQPDI